MADFKIDKNVPFPVNFKVQDDHPVTAKPKLKYPFDRMKVGDSFFAPGQVTARKGTAGQGAAHSAAKAYGRAHGLKFTGKTVVENGVKGVRIWRTS